LNILDQKSTCLGHVGLLGGVWGSGWETNKWLDANNEDNTFNTTKYGIVQHIWTFK
jgi:hypothetical protein